MRPRLATAVAIALSVAAPTVAFAEPAGPHAPPIHVVAVRSDDAEAQAEALTNAVRSRVRAARGWSLGEGDFSLEVLTLALKCPDMPDAACLARIGEQIHAERFFWGTMRRAKAKGQVQAELHYWAQGKPDAVVAVTYSDNLKTVGDDALRRIVDDAFAKLVGVVTPGRLHVRAGFESGDLLIDGQPSGALHDHEATLELAPGAYKVAARAANGVTELGSVTVRAGERVDLVLAGEGAGPPDPTEKPARLREPVNLHQVGGWAGVGLGGAFLVAGLTQTLKVRSVQNDAGFAAYRSGVPQGEDACTRAKSGIPSSNFGAPGPGEIATLCDDAKRAQTLQWVFYGVGAVAAGVGVYLLATDEGAPAAAPKAGHVDVLPTLGTRGGSLDVAVAF